MVINFMIDYMVLLVDKFSNAPVGNIAFLWIELSIILINYRNSYQALCDLGMSTMRCGNVYSHAPIAFGSLLWRGGTAGANADEVGVA